MDGLNLVDLVKRETTRVNNRNIVQERIDGELLGLTTRQQ